MSEVSPETSVSAGGGNRQRNLIIALSVVTTGAFFALLTWAVAQSGGTPGGLGVNRVFGEVSLGSRPAPPFSGTSLAGDMVDLTGLRGKVVMLDFWSSWCGPCRREAPVLAEVYEDYAGQNVEFVGIAIWDDAKNVAEHVSKYSLTYPNLLDDKGKIAIDYGVIGIPEKVFIDAQGMVVRKFIGPIEPEALAAALDELLALGDDSQVTR